MVVAARIWRVGPELTEMLTVMFDGEYTRANRWTSEPGFVGSAPPLTEYVPLVAQVNSVVCDPEQVPPFHATGQADGEVATVAVRT